MAAKDGKSVRTTFERDGLDVIRVHGPSRRPYFLQSSPMTRLSAPLSAGGDRRLGEAHGTAIPQRATARLPVASRPGAASAGLGAGSPWARALVAIGTAAARDGLGQDPRRHRMSPHGGRRPPRMHQSGRKPIHCSDQRRLPRLYWPGAAELSFLQHHCTGPASQ